MAAKLFNAAILLLLMKCTMASMTPDTNGTTYYDLESGKNLIGELEDSPRSPLSRFSFRGVPCQCKDVSCVCCVGVNITRFNFDRHACTNFSYDPSNISLKVALSLNDHVIYNTAISARNPPPICLPAPVLPFVQFCLRFFDIHTKGMNFYACIDFETKILSNSILTLHFDCVKLGASGVAWLKPGETYGNNSTSNPHSIEEYDDVDFEQQDQELVNTTPTLSPEEEDQIGQLKL